MAFTYPLDLPTDPGMIRFKLYALTAVAVSKSVYTYQEYIQAHQGQAWGAEFTLPVMTRAQAEIWQTTLLRLNGQEGTFMLGDFLSPEPRGDCSGNPKVNGANQTGNTLVTDGWAAGAIVAVGDMIQIGIRLYKYIGLTDAVADGSGNLTLDIFPRLRESPADNETIITQGCKGRFRLADNANDVYNSNNFEYYDLSFTAIEAI